MIWEWFSMFLWSYHRKKHCGEIESIMGACVEWCSPSWVCMPQKSLTIVRDFRDTNSLGWTPFHVGAHDGFFIYYMYIFLSYQIKSQSEKFRRNRQANSDLYNMPFRAKHNSSDQVYLLTEINCRIKTGSGGVCCHNARGRVRNRKSNPDGVAGGIWRTVRTSPSALWQQTPTDRS